jgi:hypothetical protein
MKLLQIEHHSCVSQTHEYWMLLSCPAEYSGWVTSKFESAFPDWRPSNGGCDNDKEFSIYYAIEWFTADKQGNYPPDTIDAATLVDHLSDELERLIQQGTPPVNAPPPPQPRFCAIQ